MESEETAQPSEAIDVEVISESDAGTKRGRGRPAGSKNKKTLLAERLGTEDAFKEWFKESKRELYAVAHDKLMESLHAGKVTPQSLVMLVGISHDKIVAEQTPVVTLNQTNININGVARDDLLKGLGAKVAKVTEAVTVSSLTSSYPDAMIDVKASEAVAQANDARK